MTLTFLVYGGLHLLAWQYNFNSTLERYLWRISAVTTASTGSLLLTLYLGHVLSMKYRNLPVSPNPKAKARVYRWSSVDLRWFSYFLVVFDIASRAFLVIESFIALPNLTHSAYKIPGWTAYMSHI